MARHTDPAWRASMRVRYDFGNAMAESVGTLDGVSPAEIDSLSDRCRRADAALKRKRAAGELEWMDLPYQDGLANQVADYAAGVWNRYDSFVVLGIGGSALGNIALHTALTHPFYNQLPAERRGNRPRVFILDNVDPDLIAGFIDTVDVERCLFNVITKSGSTAETMAQLLIFRQLLKEKLGSGYTRHVVATTDPKQGDLRKLAEQEGYRTFPIPPGVGGRFSVLSAVGLLSSAVVGIDVHELLAGAAFADELCREPDVWRNPAYASAVVQYILYQRGKPISVFMPYSQALRYVADWYRQLWAESLGKERPTAGGTERVGPTPLSALGVTDQHSMLQLFMEGPNDKVINFVTVERFGHQVPIPARLAELGSAAYLGSHTLNQLMAAEQRGVELALTTAHRPNCRHILPEINAFTVGQLLYLLEVQTAFIGELFGINAFNQPGVEAGKVATYALMGRAGYERERGRIEALPPGNPRYHI